MSGGYIQAFPGMGKSTIAVKYEQVEDCDFGNWRKEKTDGKHFWELSEEERLSLYHEFMNTIVIPFLEEGKIVLTNEPGLSELVPSGYAIHTVIPHNYFKATHLRGILNRTFENKPEDFNNPNSFVVKLAQHYNEWLKGWYGGTLHKFKSYDDWIPLIESML